MSNIRFSDQSTTGVIAVVVLILFAAIAVAMTVSGGLVDIPSTKSNQTTADSGATSSPTSMLSPRPVTTATPTDSSSVGVTPPPTSTSTQIITPTPWPKASITPTLSPVPDKNYTIFMTSFVNQLQNKPVVPIRGRGYDIIDGKVLMVVNLTTESESSLRRLREQNGILTAYAQTLLFYDQGKVSGDAPTRLQVLEVNNTGEPPRTFVANNSVVRKWSSNQIDTVEFHSQVYSTARNQTAAEKEDARNIDRTAKNYTFHNGTATPTDE